MHGFLICDLIFFLIFKRQYGFYGFFRFPWCLMFSDIATHIGVVFNCLTSLASAICKGMARLADDDIVKDFRPKR